MFNFNIYIYICIWVGGVKKVIQNWVQAQIMIECICLFGWVWELGGEGIEGDVKGNGIGVVFLNQIEYKHTFLFACTCLFEVFGAMCGGGSPQFCYTPPFRV